MGTFPYYKSKMICPLLNQIFTEYKFQAVKPEEAEPEIFIKLFSCKQISYMCIFSVEF